MILRGLRRVGAPACFYRQNSIFAPGLLDAICIHDGSLALEKSL
jgi:hypothetical protein